MSDSEEEFHLNPNVDQPINGFKIVHIYNMSDVFHLTRQVLLDTKLIQESDCFFYEILTRETDDFNDLYHFSCLIARNYIEADLYLNVDREALNYIISYIQTNSIDIQVIYTNSKLFSKIIDLSSMFVMPTLVSMLKNFYNEQHNRILLSVLGESINN